MTHLGGAMFHTRCFLIWKASTDKTQKQDLRD